MPTSNEFEGLTNKELLIRVLNTLERIDAQLQGKVGRAELFGWLTIAGIFIAFWVS